MAAATYNLTIDQGSDFAVEFTLSEDGSAKDLTGYSARAQIRKLKADNTVSASFNCTIPTPTNGVIKMEMANAVTKELDADRYFYDLEIYTASDAIVTRIMQGMVVVTQEVTR